MKDKVKTKNKLQNIHEKYIVLFFSWAELYSKSQFQGEHMMGEHNVRTLPQWCKFKTVWINYI